MNVLIRNIPEDQLLRIDYNAKKKGVSREEYLRQLIKETAEKDILVVKENQYREVLDRLITAIEENNQLMDMLATHFGIESY
ncbi:MAG: hypothetical protein GX453_08025 [Lactococcus chungangensis]|jgi:hypothetical protein|uniref:Antitoxin FitA-like ribbon-helix-helix domain-containing protein n=1 Tax=Pseudolactococcus chungangensis TaxID=451457 RepID=A0A847J2F6_9LACT|nr:hypothetical protein [Lactococcus chungangensis]